jgi:multiple sugar transport system substrate-binding protein
MPLVYLAERGKRPAEVQEWGVAPVLGVPFVGGSNLVLWQHSRQPQAALQLIRWLTLPQTQNAYNLSGGLLPVRLESLTSPEFVDDPNLARVAQGLQRGRSFPSIRLWGLIEDKLALALSQIWEEIFSPAPPEIDVLFDKYLTPLARNLNKTLGP